MLPFQGQMGSSITDLYKQVQGSTANPLDMAQASDAAARDAALRGIKGPLAVTLGNTARTNVINDFQRQRFAQLMQLNQLAMQIQQQEAQRRTQQAAGDQQKNHDFWSTVGGIGGGILGGIGGTLLMPFTGGLVNPITGAMAGYGAGSGIAGGIADATWKPSY